MVHFVIAVVVALGELAAGWGEGNGERGRGLLGRVFIGLVEPENVAVDVEEVPLPRHAG